MGIQINGNTNNINAGIGSLSIEDINELDIVGVVTAANFKTGVSNLHSVGLTLSGGQLDVGSNIKLGNAGVVTATTFVGNLTGTATQVSLAAQSLDTDCYPVFSLDATGNQALYTKSNRLSFNSATGALSATSFVGDGSNLTGISAGTSLSGSTNNTVCTVTGANAIQGEANFTFNGSKAIIKHGTTNTVSDRGLMLQASSSLTNGQVLPGITLNPNTNEHRPRAGISGIGHGSSNGTAGMHLIFMTAYRDDGSQLTSSDERLRITSDGKISTPLGTTTRIGVADRTSGTGAGGSLCVTSGAARGSGQTAGDLLLASGRGNNSAPSGTIKFGYNDGANGTSLDGEHARITSSGELWVGTTSGVSNSGYGGISLNGGSGSLLSLMQNGTEYFRLFGDSNPALQFAGVLRLFSGVSGGSNIWSVTPNGTTTGANGVTFNLKSTISHTAAVMAVSSSYNTGDLYIRIDNIYNLAGNAWWTFGLWIMSNQTVGTLAGHHSAMVHCVLTGLGSWSGISVNDIQGSMAGSVSVDQHGTNFVEIKLDAHNSSRGPCTVLCNGGTFDPPRISFH